MTIIGFNFKRFDAEKKEHQGGNIKVDNNINIKSVEEFEVNLGKGAQKALKFNFEFSSTFQPDIGRIIIAGEVIDLEDEKKVKEIVEAWKKKEKLDEKVMEPVMTYILNKSNIQALLIAKDLNLPSPVPLPRIRKLPKTK
ncbi:hypothetical protein DRJ17_02225 [Candidatus Woesearchaeota archaeon]|nr:MAG: hypothetical protein DRJ17_02225 [Candidatus Woesearchaeota archaeon]